MRRNIFDITIAPTAPDRLELGALQAVDLSGLAAFPPLLPPGLPPAVAQGALQQLDQTIPRPFPLVVGAVASDVPIGAPIVGSRKSRRPPTRPRHYHLEPWLVETLVDPRRHHGGSYRAANWVALGATSGRGRMDRHGRRAGEAPKTVLVYPVIRNAKRRLRES